jgi:hypothetical protein
VNFQAAFSHQFADQPAFENGFADLRIRVEHIAFGFDHQAAMGAEIFRDGLRDLIIAQVHVRAALPAHGGFRRGGHLQFRAALETPDQPLLNRRLLKFGRGAQRYLDAEMPAAMLADRRVSAARLPLYVAAPGARDRDAVWL